MIGDHCIDLRRYWSDPTIVAPDTACEVDDEYAQYSEELVDKIFAAQGPGAPSCPPTDGTATATTPRTAAVPTAAGPRPSPHLQPWVQDAPATSSGGFDGLPHNAQVAVARLQLLQKLWDKWD